MFEQVFKGLLGKLRYSASIPERTLRSVAAGVGGVSRLITDSLIPIPLRRSQFYKFFLGNNQKFLIEQLGQVEGAYAPEESLPDDYLPRKMAGNVVDTAGIVALHLSPLWMFALVGDVAYGSKVYLQRLVNEMKKTGVVEPDAKLTEIEDVLDAIQNSTRKSSMVFDTPPFSREDLKQLKNEVLGAYGGMAKSSRNLLPDFDKLWEQMKGIGSREGIPLHRVAGVMTLGAADLMRRSAKGVFAVGKTTGELVGETLLESYWSVLRDVQQEGFGKTLTRVSQPYVKAMLTSFDPSRDTLTEDLLTGRLFAKLRKAFRSKKKEDATAESAPPDETSEDSPAPESSPPSDSPRAPPAASPPEEKEDSR